MVSKWLLAFFLLAPAAPAGAQLVVAGRVGWYAPEIEILPEIDGGPGYDGSLRVRLLEWFELGGGVQYNVHSVGGGPDSYEVVVPFLEPRFLIPVGSGRWSTFLAPRGGWVRHSLRMFGFEVEGSGHFFGAMAGVGFRLAESVGVEGSVSWHRASVDEVDLDLERFGIDMDDLYADVPGAQIAVAWAPPL